MSGPTYIVAAVVAVMISMFATKIFDIIPTVECKRYRVEWRDASTHRNMGTKQQQIVFVPAHWEDVCIEYDEE